MAYAVLFQFTCPRGHEIGGVMVYRAAKSEAEAKTMLSGEFIQCPQCDEKWVEKVRVQCDAFEWSDDMLEDLKSRGVTVGFDGFRPPSKPS
jgi:DNA-directed RNA polymerase subunit RPC12/RpoP